MLEVTVVNRRVEVWDVTHHKQLFLSPESMHYLYAYSVSSDCRLMAVEYGDLFVIPVTAWTELVVIDLTDGRILLSRGPLTPRRGHYDGAYAFSPDSRLLAASGFRSVVVSEWASDRIVATLPYGQGGAGHIVFAPGKDLLAATNTDKTVWVWRTTDWSTVTILKPEQIPAVLAFSPDGAWLAIGEIASEHRAGVQVWETATWRLYTTLH
jgi:WD40 repeat protein